MSTEFWRGDNIQLSENFNTSEFECKCCRCGIVLISELHVAKLQKFRDYLKTPIHIVSGYRCVNHNKNVGGAPKSQHLLGTATDIIVRNMGPDEVAHFAETFGFDGIGRYNSFTHLDSRGAKARWSG